MPRSRDARATPRLVADGGAPWRSATRIELEHDARDLHVVARLETGGPQRLDHPERAQALLDVSQRLVVLDVVASDQAVDAPALHPKEARPDPVDPVGVALAGPVDAVGGGQLARRRLGLVGGHLREDRVAKRSSPSPVAADVE